MAYRKQRYTFTKDEKLNWRPRARAIRQQGETVERKSTHFHRLEMSDFKTLSKCSSSEVVKRLYADLKGFQVSLSTCNKIANTTSKLHYTLLVVSVLLKVSKEYMPGNDSDGSAIILAEFLSERCASFHMLLKEYINFLALNDKELNRNFRNIHDLFSHLLISHPMSSWCILPIDDLAEALESHELDPKLHEDIVQLKAQKDDIRVNFKLRCSNTQNIEWDNSAYRTLPILPTIQEICSSTSPTLRSSIIHGEYSSWEHYYDIQFRLLREDFIAPLRRGVLEFRHENRIKRFSDIHIYTGVQIFRPEFTNDGLCYRVRFDNEKFKQRKSWLHSKRLIFGSLLCFSPYHDNFNDECYFATVVERNPEDLLAGEFQVQFINDTVMFHHIKKTWFVVIESKAYFEAIRHILVSLQTAEVDTMPFTKYLITNRTSLVDVPNYLNSVNPVYDLCWLYPSGISKAIFSDIYSDLSNNKVNILSADQWPCVDDIELDSSQLHAFKMALTQEISLIQGPPGTGKTYIGYKIVQTLLSNRHVWDPDMTSPILVMCYTNHALDQFLEGIISHQITQGFEERIPKIARIGGRSQSEEIQKFSLRNLKKDFVPSYERHHVHMCLKRLANIPWDDLQIVTISEEMVSPAGMNRLKPYIDSSHYYQLNQITKTPKLMEHSLEIWLGLWDEVIEDPEPEQSLPINKQQEEDLYLNVNDDIDESSDSEQETEDVKESLPVLPAPEQSLPFNKEQEEDLYVNVNDDFIDLETEDLIDVMLESELEQQTRILDDESFAHVQPVATEEEESQLAPYYSKMEGQERNESDFQPEYKKKEQTEVDKILRLIQATEPLEAEEEEEIYDINDLTLQERMKLFKLWTLKCYTSLRNTCEERVKQYAEKCKQYQEAVQSEDRIVLENVEVIGMTTTGAAKYQHILHQVKPKIVIVEEAAEVLESHIVSALNGGTQHLILIGDHKQLRPKPNEYELARKHHLDVSLFERLLRNGIPHATLLIQHRMRPQIAGLVCPFVYDQLENHDIVKEYENIKSFDKNMYFFQHNKPEKEDEYLLSHSNEYEADFIVALCQHLLKQGYKPSQITILTTYTGQLLKIRSIMPRKDFEGVRVVNVDNFQGEENDIILLSLVRSNELNKVGFLREENRVCVAISRAKKGFYCFGNFKMLRNEVPLWDLILTYAEKEGCLGSEFSMHCLNHKDRKCKIREAQDFTRYFPEGGCELVCEVRLDCGHQCARQCHIKDFDHVEYKCRKPCAKLCTENLHPCRGRCGESCPDCLEIVTKVIPSCGHKLQMYCHNNPSYVRCTNPCSRLCSNNEHVCPLLCWETCAPCQVMVERTMPICQHVQLMKCYKNVSRQKCRHQCEKTCPSGHPCIKECWEDCGLCKVVMNKKMPKCSHHQSMECHIDPMSFSCQGKCEKEYSLCGHRCPKKCHEVCDMLCPVIETKQLPSCNHFVKMSCGKDPSDYKCDKPCERKLDCGHQCKQKCGDNCCTSLCEKELIVELLCGHRMNVLCKDTHRLKGLEFLCNEHCLKQLECGHKCYSKCCEPCTEICKAKIKYMCPLRHKIKIFCYQKEIAHTLCTAPCNRKLSCGHRCPRKCNQKCPEQCDVLIEKQCLCGHKHKKKCGDDSQKCSCVEKCSQPLACGHVCSGKCGECFKTRIHHPCVFDVQVNQVCGHSITVPCYGLNYECKKPCLSCCQHNLTCHHNCDQNCTCTKLCEEPCMVSCSHGSCSKACSEICDYEHCKERCDKLLKCRHYCPGLCGEKCISKCPVCNKKKFAESVTGLQKKDVFSQCYIELSCSHIFTVNYLERVFKPAVGRNYLVAPLLCPHSQCKKPVTSSYFHRLGQQKLEQVREVTRMKQRNVSEIEDTHIWREGMELIVSMRPKLVRGKSTLPRFDDRSPETFCAMRCVVSVYNLYKALREQKCNQQQTAEGKMLLLTVINLINYNRGKLSLQAICDIQSEMCRVSLKALLAKTQEQLPHLLTINKDIGAVQTLIDQMDYDHSLHISFDKYQSCLAVLQNYLTLLENRLLSVQEIPIPKLTKGEWYHCIKGSHNYFVPAGYRKKGDLPNCTICYQN